MAVYNDYVETNILAVEPLTSGLSAQGIATVEHVISFDTVAAHDAASTYRIIKAMPCTAVPLDIDIWTDGVTGMNDVNIGVYQVLRADGTGGDEVGTEVLASTLDLSSQVLKSAALDGMLNITPSNYGKALWELAGQSVTDRFSHYDIGLHSVADLSEADTIVVRSRWAF